jgi:hypothetical protein
MPERIEDRQENAPPLDNFPTDDIPPRRRTERTVPIEAESVFSNYKKWIREIALMTRETGNEHGFREDWFGNVLGIFRGDGESVNMGDDVLANYTTTVHTHPVLPYNEKRDSLRPHSKSDLYSLVELNPTPSSSTVISYTGFEGKWLLITAGKYEFRQKIARERKERVLLSSLEEVNWSKEWRRETAVDGIEEILDYLSGLLEDKGVVVEFTWTTFDA